MNKTIYTRLAINEAQTKPYAAYGYALRGQITPSDAHTITQNALEHMFETLRKEGYLTATPVSRIIKG